MVRDYNAIARALMAETQKPDPFRMNEVPVDRGFLAPLATYADGQTELALPAFPLGAIWDGVRSFGALGFDTPEAIQHNAGAAFDTAGGIVQGGLGVGLAGGLADDAVKAVAKPALEDMPARAAFKWGDDVFTGQYHGNAIRDAVDKYGKDAVIAYRDANGLDDLQSFQTLGGDFISRQQAAENIRRSGRAPGENVPNELHSDYLNELRARGLWANPKTSAAVPLLQNALERAQPQGIRAYHGSPHDFDRFSLDKIGTGEGAQAYGHGLYFAEAEDVARGYREKLGMGNSPRNYAAMDQAKEALEFAKGDKQAALKRIDDIFANSPEDRRHAELSKQYVMTPPGRMYEVNIRANPEDFLDWDKPLSQQSEAVRNALQAEPVLNAVRGGFQVLDTGNGNFSVRTPGGSIGGYASRAEAEADMLKMQQEANLSDVFVDDVAASILARHTGDPRAMSAALREAGIPGIRYLDGMSRGAGDGSSNYVVFDDQLIDILRKYANAPTGAAVPLAGETQDQDPALIEFLRSQGLL